METKRCMNCNKVIKGEPRLVLMRIDQTFFAEEFSNEVDDRDSQGWFEVGPECHRQIVKSGKAGLERRW